MKIKFNHNLDFQNDAIRSIIDIFKGQIKKNGTFTVENYAAQQRFTEIDSGISNNILLAKEDILKNVREIQLENGLEQSLKLKDLDFTIDMETGERVIIVTGCINALRSRVSGTLVNMIHALLRVIKYNYCKQCMRSKDVLALQY